MTKNRNSRFKFYHSEAHAQAEARLLEEASADVIPGALRRAREEGRKEILDKLADRIPALYGELTPGEIYGLLAQFIKDNYPKHLKPSFRFLPSQWPNEETDGEEK